MIALKIAFSPIAVGNTFRRLSAICAGCHVFESRQARYGNRQLGVGNKRGFEKASNVFRCLIESPQPKENVNLKIYFENAFNSINRQFMLKRLLKYTLNFISTNTRRTVSQVLFFYSDSVIKSYEGTQQEDSEYPTLFSDSIQNLIDSLESKINLWYLDDVNISNDYRTVLKDLKKIVGAEKNTASQN